MRSTFNLWSTLLAETRKLSRERGSLAETMASEMVARLDIMAKDVHVLTKKVHVYMYCLALALALSRGKAGGCWEARLGHCQGVLWCGQRLS